MIALRTHLLRRESPGLHVGADARLPVPHGRGPGLAVPDDLNIDGHLRFLSHCDPRDELERFVQGRGPQVADVEAGGDVAECRPSGVAQPRRWASRTTAAAVWQSSTMAMIPPLR